MCLRPTKEADLESAFSVIDAGLVSVAQLRRANAWRYDHRPHLGKLALIQGRLTVADVFKILGEQALLGGLFGQTAVTLGLLDRGDLYDLLEEQTRLTPSLVDALVATGALSAEQALSLAGPAAATTFHDDSPYAECVSQ